MADHSCDKGHMKCKSVFSVLMIGDTWSVAAITSHLCLGSEKCLGQQLQVHSQLIVVCIYCIDRPQGDRKAFKCHAFFLPAFQCGHLSLVVCESERGSWMPITREAFFWYQYHNCLLQLQILHFYKTPIIYWSP